MRTFNKRDYLIDQPKSKLYDICKAHDLKKYKKLVLFSLVTKILSLKDIDNIIYELITTDRYFEIADEDMEAIKSKVFKV